MQATNIIAISDTTGPCGAVLFWRLSGSTEYQDLDQAWNSEGLDPTWMLPPTSPLVALKAALIKVVASKRSLIRPLRGRAGYAIVKEHTIGSSGLSHDTELVIKVKNGLEFDHYDPRTVGIEMAYNKCLSEISPAAFGSWLSKLVRACHAVPLRDSGGVYFAPKMSMHKIKQICKVVEDCSDHTIHHIPSMKSAEAVGAILDSVTAEAERRMAEIEADLSKDGRKALETKEQECETFRNTLDAYRGILGPAIDRIEAALDVTKANVVEASILLS